VPWDNATANWANATGGPYNVPWSSGNDAVFEGSGGSVNVNAVSVGKMTFNAAGYSLTGSTVTLAGSTPTITSGQGISAAISSVLAGADGMTKAGSGMLVLTGANTYTNGTTVSGGTLQIGNASNNGTIGSGTYAIGSGTTLYLNYATAAAPTWSKLSGAGTLELNSAQAVNGSANWGSPALPAGFSGSIKVDKGRIHGTPSALGGAGSVIIGNGAQLLCYDGSTSGTAYTYSQSLSIQGMGWGEGGHNLGALRVSGMNASFTGAITLTGDAGLYTQTGAANSAMNITGAIGDAGEGFSLTINAASNPVTLGGNNTYGGNTNVAIGTIKLGGPDVIPDGTGKGDVSVTGVLDLNGFSETINGLSGSGTVDSVSGGTPTLMVGGNNATSTFSGSIKNTAGTLALVKTGSGILVLNGASTFAGPVTVNGGALGGTGSLQCPVTILNGGTLVPGGAAIGTLTVGNSLTYAAGSNHVARIFKSGSNLISDQVSGMTSVTYGGSLSVTASGDALTAGDSFRLFQAGVYHGEFSALNLPPLAQGLAWDVSGLAVDGILAVDAPQGLPVINESPHDASIGEGRGFTLSVSASGAAPKSYQWRKDGDVIAGAVARTYQVSSATPGDAGAYAVTVTNPLGSATSQAAAVAVIPAADTVSYAAFIVGNHKATFTTPPTATPNNLAVDAPLLGNGSTLAALAGTASAPKLYLSRNDLWVMKNATVVNGSDGGPRPLARLDLSLPGMSGASYHVEQDFLSGITNGEFVVNGTKLLMECAVSATDDVAWIQLSCTGGTVSGSANLVATAAANSSSGIAGGSQWVERSFTSGVTVPSSAASALRVVGSPDRTFVVTPEQPVLMVVSTQSSFHAAGYRNAAISRVDGFEVGDLPALRASHLGWWRDFWGKSYVEIPDQQLMQRYCLSTYLMGAASRDPDFPPGLLGWVTTDSPAWGGDYHLNYNHQAPFYGLCAGNRIEQAAPCGQPILDIAAYGRQYCQNTFGFAGIFLPVGLGPKGAITSMFLGGQKSDASYSCVPLAQQWYATRDPAFAAKAYPFVRDVAQFWENYLVLQNGRYVINNDAVHEGTNDTNPIVSLSFVRLVMKLATDMSTALGTDETRHAKWADIVTRLSAYPTTTLGQLPSNYWPSHISHSTENDSLPIFRYTEVGTPWWGDNTVGIQHIYPGAGIGLDSPPEVVQRSRNQVYALNRWVDNNGMNSFYVAAARVGYDPATILARMKSMIGQMGKTNGFYSAAGGVLENASIVPNALQEMLMQSHEGVIRFFPCWQSSLDARFGSLRADGAFLVSAKLSDGVVGDVRIVSERGQPCTIQNPWPGKAVVITRGGGSREIAQGARFTLPSVAGEIFTVAPATAYDVWAQSISDPASRAPLADPDSDGSGNLLEFAFGGDPIDSMSQATANGMLTTLGQEEALTLTVPVRAGAVFSAGTSGSLKAEVDGITCIIEGSSDLENWTASVLEITPSLPSDQPAIPSGYEYHTFRLSSSASEHDRAFLRMRALQPQ
jgi:autotransporter-associated beta strand protein